ncbi:MAG: FAD:protein FMN transferase, partial [Oscillospiraceae bacterium]
AKRYSELSQDRFDITIAPLTLLWGIDTKNARVPKQEEIDEALKLVDYENIILNESENSILLARKGMALDLGGIAKGYIVDRIKDEYQKQRITSALVSIGGNIFAYGTKPDKSLFTVGIRDPKGTTGNEILGKLTIKDKVVATTGAYERYFEQDGKKYHHILDVNTGYPYPSDLASVTIICDDGGLADFLSTTLFIAGKEHIDDYINDDRFEVIIVDNQNNVHISPSLKDGFEITNDSYTLS